MVTLIVITSFVLLLAAAYRLHRRFQTPTETAHWLPPPAPVSLFDQDTIQAALAAEDARREQARLQAQLLARAGQGDLTTLPEAYAANETALYDQTLTALTDWAVASASCTVLADYLVGQESLPANAALIAALRAGWRQTWTPRRVSQLLHLAARTGDAETLRRTLGEIRQAYHANNWPDFSPSQLAQCAESSFWLLPQAARSSGAGFVLKQELAELRRN